MGKVYAIKRGLQTGIFYNWDECKVLVQGYPGAEFKGFKTEEEALSYLGLEPGRSKNNVVSTEDCFAYVDGSFNSSTGVYGYGGFINKNGEIFELKGCNDDAEMASMRNVAGEVSGSMAAIKKAIELEIKDLTIYYDYLGIEKWATKEWKRNKEGTIQYSDFIDSVKDKINLNFVHVKGHTGIEGNEIADRLAKEAVGIGNDLDVER